GEADGGERRQVDRCGPDQGPGQRPRARHVLVLQADCGGRVPDHPRDLQRRLLEVPAERRGPGRQGVPDGGDHGRPERPGGGRLHSDPRLVQVQADHSHQRHLVVTLLVSKAAMTLKPEPAAVGSSTTGASPPQIGDTPDMSTKPAQTSALKGTRRWGDSIFYSIALAAGATIIGAIALMGLFLLIRAVPSLAADKANFITSSEFVTTDENNLRFGIADLFRVTVLSSIFALAIAVPIAIGIATFLTNYVPRRYARPFAILVDLLAAVPSIVFGLWGIFVLAPKLEPVQRFLNENLKWLFLFGDGNVSLAGGGTIFTAGVVLAVMILPIITSVSREVFTLTPKGHVEAAQALGATKWEVIRMTV